MIFEQSVLHKLNMKTSQSRDSDVTGTNCDVIKENLASLSRSDDVIVTYTKIHSLHTSISYNSCGVDKGFSLTYAGQTTQTSPFGPQKDKNGPKIKSNSNVRIQGIIENESCSTT